MLNNSFYNLALAKKAPTIAVRAGEFRGTSITFTDAAGDELKVVLPDDSMKDLAVKLMQSDLLKPLFKSACADAIREFEAQERRRIATKGKAKAHKSA